MILCALPATASAEIFTVDNLDDPGNGSCAPGSCSLREAIMATNEDEGTDAIVVEPVSGKVLVKLPGSNRFQDLTEVRAIPIGSIIDATRGKVRLTSVNAAGVEQSAVFYDGMFQITRQDRSGQVTLRLRGGDFGTCKKGPGGSDANASKRPGRRLWGSGSGKFRTEGNFGAAVVRGTVWLTKDQCKGTFFRVRQGTVRVTDFVLDKTFSLPARKKGYWAKKNP